MNLILFEDHFEIKWEVNFEIILKRAYSIIFRFTFNYNHTQYFKRIIDIFLIKNVKKLIKYSFYIYILTFANANLINKT